MNRALNRYEPQRDVMGLQDEMQRLFQSVFGGEPAATAGAWSPALDVEEDEDQFTIHIELPGVRAEDLEVNLEEGVLTVSGERRFYDERSDDSFRRIERRFGRFHRAVRLPDRVDPDKVQAEHRDGMLTIRVPKAEEARPRRIEVKAN